VSDQTGKLSGQAPAALVGMRDGASTSAGSTRTGGAAPRPWRVRLRYVPHPAPTLVELLDLTRTVERALHELGYPVRPHSVLIRTDGIAIAVTVEAGEPAQAVQAARHVVAQVASRVGVDLGWLGVDREASVRPGWRPSSR
jgi:hypothetical protein